MNKSESIQNLAAALSKAQAEFPVIKFDSVNPFLKNSYASLGAVIAGGRSVLAKYGLAVTQLTFGEDGVVGVETILTHSSGEWISDRVSMQVGEERGKSSAQVAGSIVTYLRRYSLASILGVYADEDGDGNKPAPAELKAREEKPAKAKPADDETMTIEDACKTTTSQNKQYGEMTIVGLEKMLSAMHTKLSKNELSPVEKAEVEHKIKAAQMVYNAKKNQEI
jgi:stringent starvation protein B